MNGAITSQAHASRGESRKRPPPKRPPLTLDALWHNTAVRSLLYQGLVIALVVGAVGYMIGNAQQALSDRGISTGFEFLTREAGFAIGETPIPYDPSDSILRAYAAAIANTLKVALLSIIGATVLGTLIGIARLSSNWLISRLASIYVELFRNTPQLVQIIFWYTLVILLPHPKQAWSFGEWMFLTNRGVLLAWPTTNPVYLWTLLSLILAAAAASGLARWADGRRRQTGRRVPIIWWNAALIAGLPTLVWLLGGAPTAMEYPELSGFNFVGGIAISPEFLALLLGLSLYIAAFIAEIVRSGVQAVSRGQVEAARSVGLRQSDLYRRVILPQALRVIIPPATAQYVSTAKNSSLGVAIGYPELFNVNNTIITVSGNTIECIGIMMAVYLTISFTISAVMNAYNSAVQIPER